jgi:hypothetical protein
MADVDTDQLKAAVVSQHGGPATYVGSVPVTETTVDGRTIWDGMVAVFDLNGMTNATRAYAWSAVEGSGKRRIFTVLHLGGIRSPQDAVHSVLETERLAPH